MAAPRIAVPAPSQSPALADSAYVVAGVYYARIDDADLARKRIADRQARDRAALLATHWEVTAAGRLALAEVDVAGLRRYVVTRCDDFQCQECRTGGGDV